LNEEFLASLVSQIKRLHQRGLQLLVVTSGAIHLGSASLSRRGDEDGLSVRQAAAAVGQPALMQHYITALAAEGLVGAQILLPPEDMQQRSRYLRIRNTLQVLLDQGIVPIINENDTVMVEEIHFGDNDNLAAMVTPLVDADLLIILSDVPGLFEEDPSLGKGGRIIPVVDRVDKHIEELAGGARPGTGLGGMITKVNAAKRAARYGVPSVVADGKERDIIQRIIRGENIGTIFLPQEDRLTSRKHWIAYTLKSHGDVVLDTGAVEAVVKGGKSLLPSGVVEVRGTFAQGELVVCLNKDGKRISRGLVNYSSSEIDRIKGLHSSRIQEALGFKITDEVIHRDNMVLLQ